MNSENNFPMLLFMSTNGLFLFESFSTIFSMYSRMNDTIQFNAQNQFTSDLFICLCPNT